ncbi:hypothetical protein Glove_40g162 [Diversispora epigaea]|uniref:Galactose oxidase n=1 Tax=Diversispora epigaea TaxID=1348612 RepID=A0A397JMJ5_9GLOM|nr:hypothetical protein Glove_40g162 [Diversispora epigaea]
MYLIKIAAIRGGGTCFLVYKSKTLKNCVIINDRLLIIGGQNVTENTYELFYLNLSKSFDNTNNTNLPWNLIHEGDLPITTFSSTTVVSLDNSTIFLIGGYIVNKITLDYDFSNQVYTYNYLASKWTTPSITGIPIRQQMTGVIDNKGIIYIFGGLNVTNLTTLTTEVYNDMNTLDTSSMTWKTLNITDNLPPLNCDYSASILPNGIIVYFGGQDETDILVKMTNIKLFNTKKDEWSYMVATGDDVDPRWSFASVLTQDGYIIIFGGCTLDHTGINPKVAVLDTNKSPYEWSIPSSSKVNSLPSIYGHKANLYYNYAIITFGYDMDNDDYNSKIYLYDITNNTWVTRFDPPPSPSPSPSFSPSSSPPTPIFNSIPTSTPPKFLKPLLIGLGTGIENSSSRILRESFEECAIQLHHYTPQDEIDKGTIYLFANKELFAALHNLDEECLEKLNLEFERLREIM